MTIIGLKELSQNAGKIAERAKAGEEFVVMNRSTPMFNISPHKEKPTVNLKASEDHVRKLVKKHQKAFDALYKK